MLAMVVVVAVALTRIAFQIGRAGLLSRLWGESERAGSTFEAADFANWFRSVHRLGIFQRSRLSQSKEEHGAGAHKKTTSVPEYAFFGHRKSVIGR